MSFQLCIEPSFAVSEREQDDWEAEGYHLQNVRSCTSLDRASRLSMMSWSMFFVHQCFS